MSLWDCLGQSRVALQRLRKEKQAWMHFCAATNDDRRYEQLGMPMASLGMDPPPSYEPQGQGPTFNSKPGRTQSGAQARTPSQDEASGQPGDAVLPSERRGKVAILESPQSQCFHSFMNAELQPGSPWMALIHVQTEDLHRLMRDGLHWSEDNVDREKGYLVMTSHREKWERRPPWIRGITDATCFRSYSLSSSLPLSASSSLLSLSASTLNAKNTGSGGQRYHGLNWTADIFVAASDMRKLSAFRLSDLCPDKILQAWAWDSKARTVYCFRADKPDEYFNCIHDDEVLGYGWPWPKPSCEREQGQQHEQEQEKGEEEDREEEQPAGQPVPLGVEA